MECRFEKNIRIPLSWCDNRGGMSVNSIFTLFMDMAAEHAEDIELGAEKMAERGMFWLTAKTKIHINRRPKMMETATAATWPEAPGRIRCNRFYELYTGETVLAEGITEWAIIDVNTGKLCRASDIYMQGTCFSEKKANVEPFEKIPEDFSGGEILGTYRIRSTDIDLGQHMNNAAYVRAMMGVLSCAELENTNVTDAEVVFKTPCYEGNELTIYRRPTENGFDIGMLLHDGRTAAAARFKTK